MTRRRVDGRKGCRILRKRGESPSPEPELLTTPEWKEDELLDLQVFSLRPSRSLHVVIEEDDYVPM